MLADDAVTCQTGYNEDMAFTFFSGNLALDLAGTVSHRRTDRSDALAAPADLARWVADAGILDRRPDVTAADLETGIALREAAYRLALAPAGQLVPADLAIVNAAAAHPPVTVRLNSDGTVSHDGDIAAALSSVARSAVELLGAPHVIKECQADECTRLYADTSRRGGRRWCDMRDCGNRAKVAAYRTRQESIRV